MKLRCASILLAVLLAGCATAKFDEVKTVRPTGPSIAGLPPAGTVTAPSGRVYKFYKTTDAGAQVRFEREVALSASVVHTLRLAEKPKAADWFKGKKRASAKTSIVHGKVTRYKSLSSLLASLKSDEEMQDYDPPLNSKSERSEDESRNVGVCADMVAAKREADADYHVILSNGEDTFLNAEVSGIPKDATDETTDRLLKVRRAFETFVKGEGRGVSSYSEWEPVPVYIEGSLFYDIDHPPGQVGPAFARPDTSWEIHPVTKIVWEPTNECKSQ